MKWFEDIYRFFQSIFEKLTFRGKHHGYEFFYDDDSCHTVYEYDFVSHTVYEYDSIPTKENKIERL